MKPRTCKNCGERYAPDSPESAGAALISGSSKFFDVAPELRTSVACPKCGHKEPSEQNKYFGFLPAGGVRIVVALILIAMLALGIAFTD